jgi:hypothetical protein
MSTTTMPLMELSSGDADDGGVDHTHVTPAFEDVIIMKQTRRSHTRYMTRDGYISTISLRHYIMRRQPLDETF